MARAASPSRGVPRRPTLTFTLAISVKRYCRNETNKYWTFCEEPINLILPKLKYQKLTFFSKSKHQDGASGHPSACSTTRLLAESHWWSLGWFLGQAGATAPPRCAATLPLTRLLWLRWGHALHGYVRTRAQNAITDAKEQRLCGGATKLKIDLMNVDHRTPSLLSR